MKHSLLLSSFPEAEQQLIQKHLELVLAANEIHNLTRITSFEEAQILHIEDSLLAFPEMQQAPPGKYADLGTGGGFPGIPLAITTHRQSTLVDSVKKKATVLSQMIADLGLKNSVDVFAGRIEELSTKSPRMFSVLTARALSSLPALLELSAPLLVESGQLVCYKAIIDDNELNSALLLNNKLGMKLVSDRSAILSDKKTQRRILVFEKFKEPEVVLPRRTGLAQKRPYC